MFRMLLVTVLFCWTIAEASDTPSYQYSSEGTRLLESENSGIVLKVLVERTNLGGGEVEIGEIRFPAGYESRAHVHRIEIFYVLEGKLLHNVNGDERILTPGMVGIVRAPDEVIHKAIDGAVRAIVIWPGSGELEGLSKIWQERPVADTP